MSRDSVACQRMNASNTEGLSSSSTRAVSPIEDRNEFERRLDALPPDQKELAQENARFADLCRYFSDKKMDIPPQVLDQVGRLARLPIVDRIRVLKDANRTLMEYLSDVGEDPQIRQ